MDNFKKLDTEWVSKVDFLDDVFEASVESKIVIHKNQQEEFTKFLAENGFEHKIIAENLETYVANAFYLINNSTIVVATKLRFGYQNICN